MRWEDAPRSTTPLDLAAGLLPRRLIDRKSRDDSADSSAGPLPLRSRRAYGRRRRVVLGDKAAAVDRVPAAVT
jgi:hypothetical protein